LHVYSEGGDRSVPRLARVALRRQVKDAIGERAADRMIDRVAVLDVALVQHEPPEQMVDRSGIAAPALERMDLQVGQRQQVVGESTPHRARDTGYEDAHRVRLMVEPGLDSTRAQCWRVF